MPYAAEPDSYDHSSFLHNLITQNCQEAFELSSKNLLASFLTLILAVRGLAYKITAITLIERLRKIKTMFQNGPG